MHFDRFDIIEAYYVYFSDYHGGQNDPQYQRLCKIRKYFKPSDNLKANGVQALSENGWEIYQTFFNRDWEN